MLMFKQCLNSTKRRHTLVVFYDNFLYVKSFSDICPTYECKEERLIFLKQQTDWLSKNGQSWAFLGKMLFFLVNLRLTLHHVTFHPVFSIYSKTSEQRTPQGLRKTVRYSEVSAVGRFCQNTQILSVLDFINLCRHFWTKRLRNIDYIQKYKIFIS